MLLCSRLQWSRLLWSRLLCNRLLFLLGFKLFLIKRICSGVPYLFQQCLINWHEFILDDIWCIVCSIFFLRWLLSILRTAIFNLFIISFVLFACWFYFFLSSRLNHGSKGLGLGQFEHPLKCIRRQYLLKITVKSLYMVR